MINRITVTAEFNKYLNYNKNDKTETEKIKKINES